MDIPAYCRRIGYDGSAAPTRETLCRLHRDHLLTVPFENLDISCGREIVLDEGRFFDKIVRHHRGGFCYELNGLFAAMLRELGFEVALLSARVAGEGSRFSREFDHLTLMVRAPGESEVKWLGDVGFGDGFEEPLELRAGLEQVQAKGTFRLRFPEGRWILERRDETDWNPVYDFSPIKHELTEFEEMCRYHQTSPESHFTQNQICSLATPAGRVTLAGKRMIETDHGRRTEQTLQSDQEYSAVLRERFGVVLD
jgi:N-hydroxyarylamine O-acetyltransferase